MKSRTPCRNRICNYREELLLLIFPVRIEREEGVVGMMEVRELLVSQTESQYGLGG